jgi:hypothetical protein
VRLTSPGLIVDLSMLTRYEGSGNQVLTAENAWNVFESSEEDCHITTYGVYVYDGTSYSLYSSPNIYLSGANDLVVDTSQDFALIRVYIGATITSPLSINYIPVDVQVVQVVDCLPTIKTAAKVHNFKF